MNVGVEANSGGRQWFCSFSRRVVFALALTASNHWPLQFSAASRVRPSELRDDEISWTNRTQLEPTGIKIHRVWLLVALLKLMSSKLEGVHSRRVEDRERRQRKGWTMMVNCSPQTHKRGTGEQSSLYVVYTHNIYSDLFPRFTQTDTGIFSHKRKGEMTFCGQ